jgi:hypothetical protein
MAHTSVEGWSVKRSAAIEGFVAWLAEHWLAIVTALVALYAGLPWLAPVFMKLGWTGPAQAIYLIYSFMCHQLPQRSYFLFGPKLTYSLAEISAVWPWQTFTDTSTPLSASLRQFIGTPEMGYKVAYAHRLTAIWTSVLAGSLLFGLLRRRRRPELVEGPVEGLRPLPFKGYLLLMLPMVVDGFTLMFGEGRFANRPYIDWRTTNAWFQPVANWLGLQLSESFYTGTALGSLNWVLRTLTGGLFGLASVWFAYPYIERAMWDIRRSLAPSQGVAQDAMTPQQQADRG